MSITATFVEALKEPAVEIGAIALAAVTSAALTALNPVWAKRLNRFLPAINQIDAMVPLILPAVDRKWVGKVEYAQALTETLQDIASGELGTPMLLSYGKLAAKALDSPKLFNRILERAELEFKPTAHDQSIAFQTA